LVLNKIVKDVINIRSVNNVFDGHVIIIYLRQVYINYKNQSLWGLCVLGVYNLYKHYIFCI
jgi:hypothetical protein